MTTTRVISSSILGLLVCFQAGCSMPTLNRNSIKNNAVVRHIDPNDGPYSIEVIQRSDGSRDYWWDIDSQIEQAGTCRVKYHPLHTTRGFMVVDGEVVNGKNTYPIVLDTGASQAIFVRDTHVLENDLPIYPFETNQLNLNGYNLGLCHLPNLQIASVKLLNWPCFYLERSTNLTPFGLLIAIDDYKDDSIIVGLPVLRNFKYIVFDSVRKEVQFSSDKVFNPEMPELWAQHPISIEHDLHKNAFLFVQIPVAGHKTEFQLDTGSGRGLAVAEKLWEEVHQNLRGVKLTTGRDPYPYIGMMACKKGIIPNLQLGNRAIKNVNISVLPNDSPIVDQCQGLLGMQCFRDTVMTLDFERNLMWVKGAPAQ